MDESMAAIIPTHRSAHAKTASGAARQSSIRRFPGIFNFREKFCRR
jgi:hypothetical protein